MLRQYLFNQIYSYREIEGIFDEVIEMEVNYYNKTGKVILSYFWRGDC